MIKMITFFCNERPTLSLEYTILFYSIFYFILLSILLHFILNCAFSEEYLYCCISLWYVGYEGRLQRDGDGSHIARL